LSAILLIFIFLFHSYKAFFQAFLLQEERMGQTSSIFCYHKGLAELFSAGNLSLGKPGIWWERTEHPTKRDDATTICPL